MSLLKSKGLKATKTRVKILNLLENDSPLSAEQIYDKLKDNKIKISSIYRNLATFVDESILIRTVGLDNISYYQLNNEKKHKHQIICTNCGLIVIIENCPLDEVEAEVERRTGFIVKSHSFEFSGLCADCQKLLNED